MLNNEKGKIKKILQDEMKSRKMGRKIIIKIINTEKKK